MRAPRSPRRLPRRAAPRGSPSLPLAVAAEPASARELVAEAFARHFAPPPSITVDEWAEKFRWLEKRTTAAGGPWRNYRTPYLIEVQRVLTDPTVRRVAIQKAAQTGGSEVALNWIFRQIECDPGPILWVTSGLEQVSKISRRRIDPMLDREPLRARVPRRKSRDSDRTTSQVSFEGGSLGIVTANSPAALSSDPQRDLVFDEVDRYAPSSGSEGDPLDLGNARQQTFERLGAKTVYVSTPGIDGQSRISKLYEGSDQRRYHVPCPECGTLQELVWLGKHPDGRKFGVIWDRSLPKEQAPPTAYYQCEHCPARWTDAQRWESTQPEAGARWIASRPFAGTAGFYVPGMLSSFVRLADMVKLWLDAQGDPSKLQTFANLQLGLPFSLTAEEAPKSLPLERWEGFDVPASVCCLLGFVDVQSDRLEVTVGGFGPDGTLCVATHEQLQGVTKLPPVWADLERLMVGHWKRSDGKRISLSALGIDCGYDFERVTDWAAHASEKFGLRVFAIKGVSRGIEEPIVRERVAGRAHGGRLFYVSNSDAAKLAVIQRLQLREGPGRIRFPARGCFGAEYQAQLRAEKLQRRYVRGYPVVEWFAKPGERNEALDCLAGLYAVREWLNPALDVMEQTNAAIVAPPPEPEPVPEPPKPKPVPDTAERAPVRPVEPRAPAPLVAPRAPIQVVRRDGGGAWFDSHRAGRR